MGKSDTFDLSTFADAGLTLGVLSEHLDRHERVTLPRCELLWRYYRNPMSLGVAGEQHAKPGSALWRSRGPLGLHAHRYRLAQESGLPARLTGAAGSRVGLGGMGGIGAAGWTMGDEFTSQVRRKEIVIENDIAWRVHTMIDFMFGRPVVISSLAGDPARRRLIEQTLDAVWEASGGVGLLQDLALLAHVYGYVDLIVRAAPRGEGRTGSADAAALATDLVRVETVDPTRGIAIVDASDYRRLSAYVLRWRRRGGLSAARTSDSASDAPPRHEDGGRVARLGPSAPSILRRILDRWSSNEPAGAMNAHQSGGTARDGSGSTLVTEILDGRTRRVYEQRVLDGGALEAPVLAEETPALVESDRAALLSPPVVHIQNLSQPLTYEGLSEVEALIPLQDELNTRLSDRASRVTLQSFKMLLAKGMGDVRGMTVAPGVVWQTDNPEARIESFGGDGASPSEDRHIDEVREAMDKLSGVPPLAGGVVRAKLGNLSSANALRVTLMGLLSKTARKRITYGRGIAEASRLVLEALDAHGVLKTDPAERIVRVEWPDPLPRDEREVLETALKKLELGIDRERVLAELGYGQVQGIE